MHKLLKIFLYGVLLRTSIIFFIFLNSLFIKIFPVLEKLNFLSQIITGTIIISFFSVLYFKDVDEYEIHEGLFVGCVWIVLGMGIDLIMQFFLSNNLNFLTFLLNELDLLVILITTISYSIVVKFRNEA